jgi:acetylglutamate kinase
VDPAPLRALWSAGYVPVVAPVSGGEDGRALNVNADEAALAVARALGARSLVYLSDVDGVNEEGQPLAVLDALDAERRIAAGIISGGMALKVRAALQAAAAGIPEVVVAGKARLLGGFPGTRIVARRAA